MTECVHCGQPVILVDGRWMHVTRFSRHGWRDRPAFVTCPTGCLAAQASYYATLTRQETTP